MLVPGGRSRSCSPKPTRGGGGCGARTRAPRDADGRPNALAARRADDVRPQGGGLANRGRRGTRTARAGFRERLAAQPGRADGRSRGFGDGGVALLELYAGELALETPTVPWHTNRTRVAEWRRTLPPQPVSPPDSPSISVLSAQTEVAEVSEGAEDGPRRCRRSATRSARRSRARALGWPPFPRGVLTGSLEQEHERAAAPGRRSGRRSPARSRRRAGRCGVAGAFESLEVDSARMRASLDLTGGLVLAERVSFLLRDRLAGWRRSRSCVRRTQAGRAWERLLAQPRAGLTPPSSTRCSIRRRTSDRRRARRPCARVYESSQRGRYAVAPSARRTGGAPPLLLCDSLGTTLAMWGVAGSALTAQFRLVRYDRRGQGRSAVPPGPYSIDDLGRDAVGLLDELGSSEPRSAACRSAASSACGSRQGRRSGSTPASSANGTELPAARAVARPRGHGARGRGRGGGRGGSRRGSCRRRPTRCGRRSARCSPSPSRGRMRVAARRCRGRPKRPTGRDRGPDARRQRGGGPGRTAGRRRPARRFDPGRSARDDPRSRSHRERRAARRRSPSTCSPT